MEYKEIVKQDRIGEITRVKTGVFIPGQFTIEINVYDKYVYDSLDVSLSKDEAKALRDELNKFING